MELEFRRSGRGILKAIEIVEPKEGEDYIIPACISSTAADVQRTRMDLETTLKNFEREVSEGVPTMDSHNRELGLGVTSHGSLEDEMLLADLGIVPDTALSGNASYPNTDIFVKMIRRRAVQDVSVGAYGGVWECNICGRDMWRAYGCYHWPGYIYQIEDADTDKIREVECVPVIKDAHLAEVSFTYSGANKDAKIIENSAQLIERAANHVEAGWLDSKQIGFINKSFGAALDVRSANNYKTPMIQGGFSTMDLTQAKARITELETEVDTLKSQNTELETTNTDLASARAELDIERADLQAKTIEDYKVYRDKNLTGEALLAYEKKLSKYDLRELKEEHEMMQDLVKPKAAEGSDEVEAGQKTIQTDKSSDSGAQNHSDDVPQWVINARTAAQK